MRLALALLLLGSAVWADDAEFNGRWNIQVQTPRGRVWWLEITGAGGPKPEGSFVGAPGGGVDVLPNLKIAGGEIEFAFEGLDWGPNGSRPPYKQVFRAHLEGGKLTGTREYILDGVKQPTLKWVGVRAPIISEKDDGSWTPGRSVVLFDGKSTGGWHLLVPGRPDWYVEDGLLKNRPGAADLVSDAKFWNFILKVEYRYSAHSNSGIGLRGRYEIQIYDSFGEPPEYKGHGALYSRKAPEVNASKRAGEWQTLEARIVGRDLTVFLNGEKILDHVDVIGPTAMTMDAEEDQPGPVVLQGDHGPIEFRSISITELQRK